MRIRRRRRRLHHYEYSLNANLRVPVLGETPTALGDNEFTGVSSYNSLQITLRGQVWHGLSFQGNYTYSRAMTKRR